MIREMLGHIGMIRRLLRARKDAYVPIGTLKAEAFATHEPTEKREWKTLGYSPIREGETWTKERFGCAVFRFAGAPPADAEGEIAVRIDAGAEGEIYDAELNPICGVSQTMSAIDFCQPLRGKQLVRPKGLEPGREITLYGDFGHNGYCGAFVGNPKFAKAEFVKVDALARDYYYDLLYMFLNLVGRKSNRFLDKAGIAETERIFFESFRLRDSGDLAGARSITSEFLAERQTEGPKYAALGHGHLDLAWKWPIREGRRKAVRTLSNVADFLERRDFVFGASQAQMFEWAEEAEPALFERVREAVDAGGIEILGGMWTECDCNMPCGESLIRQFLYGREYFVGRFGVDSDVAWLPDSFGFPHSLPQILAGVGKKYFLTTKLSRNDTTAFPFQSFRWVGPDGSSVVCHMPPEGRYASSGGPIPFAKGDAKNAQKELGAALLIYGVGDGGGGPSEGHLEMVARAGGKYSVAAESAPSSSVFEALEKKQLPEFDGELYLEKHRGVLTSQAKLKRYNRLSEMKFHVLEWLEAATKKCETRDRIWKKILTCQFHDILPGSGIARVCEEGARDYAEACAELDSEIAERLRLLSTGRPGRHALNPSPFARSELAIVGGEAFRAECGPYSSAELKKTTVSGLGCGESHIENSRLRVVLDPCGAGISRVEDKDRGGAVVSGEAFFGLNLYPDKKTPYDAWDIDKGYLKRRGAPVKAWNAEISLSEGCAKAVATGFCGSSNVEIEIRLTDEKIVYFVVRVDWNERHKMLRADFRPAVFSDVAEFDIQFGSIARSTHCDKALEKAKYEVCAHKYAMVGDEKRGFFSVMSRDKFGYCVRDGKISLNLLRAPTFPDPHCDAGRHEIEFAAVFADSREDVAKIAYNYNLPLIIADREIVAPDLNFLIGEGIIVETIKPAETGSGVVLRAYERRGRAAKAELRIGEDRECFETDMLELNPRAVGSEIEFRPHEIKTLIVKRK